MRPVAASLWSAARSSRRSGQTSGSWRSAGVDERFWSSTTAAPRPRGRESRPAHQQPCAQAARSAARAGYREPPGGQATRIAQSTSAPPRVPPPAQQRVPAAREQEELPVRRRGRCGAVRARSPAAEPSATTPLGARPPCSPRRHVLPGSSARPARSPVARGHPSRYSSAWMGRKIASPGAARRCDQLVAARRVRSDSSSRPSRMRRHTGRSRAPPPVGALEPHASSARQPRTLAATVMRRHPPLPRSLSRR